LKTFFNGLNSLYTNKKTRGKKMNVVKQSEAVKQSETDARVNRDELIIMINGMTGDWKITVQYKNVSYLYVGWDSMVIDRIERLRHYKPFKAWNIIKTSFQRVL
jgi:hypothetical protein